MRKEVRLKRRAAFAYVYRKGESSGAAHMLLLSAKSREGLKIGLSVSKKVGNAVTRNRTKRLLREAVAPILNDIDPSFMYVLVARPSIAGLSLNQISAEVSKVFSKAGKLKARDQ